MAKQISKRDKTSLVIDRAKRYWPFCPLFRTYLRHESEKGISAAAQQLTGPDKLLLQHLHEHRGQICTFEDLYRLMWDDTEIQDGQSKVHSAVSHR